MIGSLFSSTEAPSARQVRAARLEAARRNQYWTELSSPLVDRGLRLVDAGTDATFLGYRGVVWQTGSATAISDRAPLYFRVDDDGDLCFYEKQRETWSEVYARQCEREAARR